MGCCQGTERGPGKNAAAGKGAGGGLPCEKAKVVAEVRGSGGDEDEGEVLEFTSSDFREALAANFPLFCQKYEVLEEIGSGLGSATFICEPKDKSLHGQPTYTPRLCCKVIKAATSPEDTKQHWKEIVSYKALSPDDRIAEMVDHFMNEHWAVVVLEVSEGGHLIVGDYRWPESTVASVAKQILLLLDDMHSAGYCHLDIKPNHILLSERPNAPHNNSLAVRICGFSCCTRFKPGTPTLAEIPESPLFIAPEIWKIVMGVPSGTLYDERCDLWSLGVVCYLMLSGRHPFTDKNVKDCQENDYVNLYEAIYARDEEVITFPDDVFAGVSDAARHFLLDLLQIDFRSRSTAAQALNHPFLRKHNPDLSYLDGTRTSRVLFHFEPLRTDVNVAKLGTLMKPRVSLNASSTGSPSPFLAIPGDDCTSPNLDTSLTGMEPQTSSRRRKMSWTEEGPPFVRNDSGGRLELVMEATPTQASICGSESGTGAGGRLKSPKLFMGSPVKAPLHVNPNSPHLQPPPFFPKERRFEKGKGDVGDDDELSDSSEEFSIGAPAAPAVPREHLEADDDLVDNTSDDAPLGKDSPAREADDQICVSGSREEVGSNPGTSGEIEKNDDRGGQEGETVERTPTPVML